jgi:catechol 2,3-dioxygenase-like lactoylglutathione lyase family enzyme
MSMPDHVTIAVNDLDRAKAFYAAVTAAGGRDNRPRSAPALPSPLLQCVYLRSGRAQCRSGVSCFWLTPSIRAGEIDDRTALI